MDDPVIEAVNAVRVNLGMPALAEAADHLSLRGDLGFDSLALAELTVRIEDATGVDVFAGGIVSTVGEIRKRLEQSREP